MESLLSGISTSSPESLYDLYGEDLKRFYRRIYKHGSQEAEWSRLFSWIMPAPFRVLVAGEYNHGKTAVINFLLGRNNLLPVSPKRETKITTYVFPLYFSNFSGFGVNHEHALLVNKKEKSFRVIELPDLKAVVNDPNIEPLDYDLYVYLDNKLLYQNVVFIDTPGFIVEHEHEWYPELQARTSDLILLVSDLNKPFTRYHDHFIKRIGNHARKLILAVNKVDLATNPQDIKDALTHLLTRKREYAFDLKWFFVSVPDMKISPDKLIAGLCPLDASQEPGRDMKKKGSGDTAEAYAESDGERDAEEIVSSLKPGVWENIKFWEYMYCEISQNRITRKSDNWMLNIVELFGGSHHIGEEETHRVCEEISEAVKETEDEMAAFEEIYRTTVNERSISDDMIASKVREFEEEINRIIYEYSNTANVGIVDKLSKCTKKKEVERIQPELQRYLKHQLEAALNDIHALIEKQTASLNLFWFKILSQIPDGRLVDNLLTPGRASELRTILYEHLFEEQYFWRKVSWEGLIKILRQKGYSRAGERKDNIAWFIHAVRSCFFDCNAPEYILKHIVEGVEFPGLPDKELSRMRHAGWSTIKSPGFLFFGTSAVKYRSHVQHYVQNYQLEKFNALKKQFAAGSAGYKQAAGEILKDIELRLRNSLAEGIQNLRNDTNRRTVRELIQKLEQVTDGLSLPFEDDISA